jgi:anti-sigma regulatory factor (Ser/Thr protein kinase)
MVFEVENYDTLRHAVDALTAFLCAENVAEERIFDSKLVVSELLGNILRHADGKAKFRFKIQDGFVEMHIECQKNYVPKNFIEPVCSDVFSEHGRGLFIIKNFSEECIFSDTDGIKVKIKVHS